MPPAHGGSSAMDTIHAIRSYIDKIVTSIPGMKALLLDSDTKQIVAMVYSQTTILEKEVYLVEELKSSHEPMMHLKAACLVRPTEENINLLSKELRDPKYNEYYIFFTNVVPADYLRTIAEADEHDSVKQVQEYYADYLAVNPEIFTLNLKNSLLVSAPIPRGPEYGPLQDQSSKMITRNVQGILSVLLSFKKKPIQIRYQGASSLARQLAGEIATQLAGDQIFDFRRSEGPTLLILDRRDDPITPLLTQWTYQAMVHELLGINNNRVSLKDTPKCPPEMEEVVLSVNQDDFFAKHRNSHFADFAGAIKTLIDDYARQSKLQENIKSIDDMQRFMESYPKFRAQSLTVSKHMAIISEISRQIDKYHLMEISELEQQLACDEDQQGHHRKLLEKIADPSIRAVDKVRLSMLYILRYEESAHNLGVIKQHLQNAQVIPDLILHLDGLLLYAGASRRAPGLYGERGVFSNIGKKMKESLIEGVKDVYTQHVPLVMQIVDQTIKGKLSKSQFPSIGSSDVTRTNDVIVYIAGGVTFEEATKVAELNAQSPSGSKIVLGGPFIHNSTSFMEDIRKYYCS